MFSDMDQNLREMGVADLGVGKRVRRMWEAFHGRATAYTAALAHADDAALVAALSRNVWRSAEPVAAAPRLAVATRRQRAHLGGQPFAARCRSCRPPSRSRDA
jgi:cytochrome b pre-mRNA-processing protein 3